MRNDPAARTTCWVKDYSGSKPKMSAQFDNALTSDDPGDCAGRSVGQSAAAVLTDVGIRVVEVHMIEHVVSVSLDFESHPFADGELFPKTKVYVCKARSNQRI